MEMDGEEGRGVEEDGEGPEKGGEGGGGGWRGLEEGARLIALGTLHLIPGVWGGSRSLDRHSWRRTESWSLSYILTLLSLLSKPNSIATSLLADEMEAENLLGHWARLPL